MKIQCLRIRPNGSEVLLGTKTYHFKPNDLGHHVCDVTDKSHINTLLKISAYVIYDEDQERASSGAGGDDLADEEDAAVEEDADEGDGDGDDGVIEEDVGGAGDEQDEGDENADPDIEAAILALSDEEAIARFKEVMGRDPHPAAKTATIKARLIQAATEAAKTASA